MLKIKEEENRLRQNYFLCEELIKMDMSVTDLSEEMLDKMISGKEEYIYQLERIKRQDRIQKIFDISKLIGCILPLVANQIGLDPAIMASPLITTIVDTCSILVYFNIAVHIFNL